MCQALETNNKEHKSDKALPSWTSYHDGETNINHRITYECIIKTVKESFLKKKYLVGGADMD